MPITLLYTLRLATQHYKVASHSNSMPLFNPASLPFRTLVLLTMMMIALAFKELAFRVYTYTYEPCA